MTDVKSIYYITKQLISARHCCKNSAINNRNHRSRSLETVSYESNLKRTRNETYLPKLDVGTCISNTY